MHFHYYSDIFPPLTYCFLLFSQDKITWFLLEFFYLILMLFFFFCFLISLKEKKKKNVSCPRRHTPDPARFRTTHFTFPLWSRVTKFHAQRYIHSREPEKERATYKYNTHYKDVLFIFGRNAHFRKILLSCFFFLFHLALVVHHYSQHLCFNIFFVINIFWQNVIKNTFAKYFTWERLKQLRIEKVLIEWID